MQSRFRFTKKRWYVPMLFFDITSVLGLVLMWNSGSTKKNFWLKLLVSFLVPAVHLSANFAPITAQASNTNQQVAVKVATPTPTPTPTPTDPPLDIPDPTVTPTPIPTDPPLETPDPTVTPTPTPTALIDSSELMEQDN